MIERLDVRNFRGFKKYSLSNLGRVNLLVGKNNSGKTSLLEALQVLFSEQDPRSLYVPLLRRGEEVFEESGGQPGREVDIRLLFNGYKLEPRAEFSLSAKGAGRGHALSVTVAVAEDVKQQVLFDDLESSDLSTLGLLLTWSASPQSMTLPLTSRGGLSSNLVRRFRRHAPESNTRLMHVTSASLNIDQVVGLFSDVVLTDNEALVLEALRILEPDIERIAPLSDRGHLARSTLGERGGIVLRCTGVDERLPIGCMGDGIWRMLGLALALVAAKGGVLLVDEIDTGLHYSVMVDMWRLIYETARRLDVQVFATTHNSDCWRSLAYLTQSQPSEVLQKDPVSIQRIDRQGLEATSFTASEMVIAAQEDIEVR